jgi:hypothetical protein
MRVLLPIILIIFMMQACVSTRCDTPETEKATVSMDPHIRNWLATTDEKSEERLAIIVATNGDMADTPFLTKISENYYTGNVRYSELKNLMNDSRVKRISSGAQELHQ